jgi:hypothetical protein
MPELKFDPSALIFTDPESGKSVKAILSDVVPEDEISVAINEIESHYRMIRMDFESNHKKLERLKWYYDRTNALVVTISNAVRDMTDPKYQIPYTEPHVSGMTSGGATDTRLNEWTEEEFRMQEEILRQLGKNNPPGFIRITKWFPKEMEDYKKEKSELDEIVREMKALAPKLRQIDAHFRVSDMLRVELPKVLSAAKEFAIKTKTPVDLPDFVVDYESSMAVNKSFFTEKQEDKRKSNILRLLLIMKYLFVNSHLLTQHYYEWYKGKKYEDYLKAKKRFESGMGCEPFASVWSFSIERKYFQDILGDSDPQLRSLAEFTEKSHGLPRPLSRLSEYDQRWLQILEDLDISYQELNSYYPLKPSDIPVGSGQFKDVEELNMYEENRAMNQYYRERMNRNDKEKDEFPLPKYLTPKMLERIDSWDMGMLGGVPSSADSKEMIRRYMKYINVKEEDYRRILREIPSYSNCFSESLLAIYPKNRKQQLEYENNQHIKTDSKGNPISALEALYPKTPKDKLEQLAPEGALKISSVISTGNSSTSEYEKIMDMYDWKNLLWN